MHRLIFRAIFILLLAAAVEARAEEAILSYHSDIAIAADATMTVRETITVRAEGAKIRRGIYRDFPTTYRDPLGHRYVTGFEFISAQRDGQPEPWHIKNLSNGVRVYLGKEGISIEPGEHTYILEYLTSRQLGFFDDHDELFWNVTGNGWAFPIESASARIQLPASVARDSLKAFGYTGAQGSTAANLEFSVTKEGANYRSSSKLEPGEGLSVVLEFPKSIVVEPSLKQKLEWLLSDNLHLMIGFVGLLLAWVYYGLIWSRYGRDPKPGIVIPLYQPPRGYSPASLRYIRRMGYDKSCFAAAILGLAAKGALDIKEHSGVITLKQTGKRVDFAAGEAAIMSKLLGKSSSITLKSSASTARTMSAARTAHKAALATDYEKKYFLTHSKKLIPGLVLSIGFLLASVIALPGDAMVVVLFLSVWLSLWSLGVYALVSSAINAWSAGRGILSKAGSIFIWAFATPFIFAEIAGIVVMATTAGLGLMCVFIALIGTNIVFYHWMKSPTRDGAKLLDQIEGFRWYLGVAEKQELDSRYRPEDHPEQFSSLLPYAFALDVEQAWARRFAEALPADQLAKVQPAWYHGGAALGATSLASFTSGLTSGLSSSISSASTAPGSSSSGGSSGSSGSSGGGGGGGGGGGW